VRLNIVLNIDCRLFNSSFAKEMWPMMETNTHTSTHQIMAFFPSFPLEEGNNQISKYYDKNCARRREPCPKH